MRARRKSVIRDIYTKVCDHVAFVSPVLHHTSGYRFQIKNRRETSQRKKSTIVIIQQTILSRFKFDSSSRSPMLYCEKNYDEHHSLLNNVPRQEYNGKR
ncbi:hypothetical protein BJ165DRAFT_1475838 [Panaeolus papilionaceus]|nr:hypothetical protein BJ165DRAFT_1475838 [Panaeolus papilionaceus]